MGIALILAFETSEDAKLLPYSSYTREKLIKEWNEKLPMKTMKFHWPSKQDTEEISRNANEEMQENIRRNQENSSRLNIKFIKIIPGIIAIIAAIKRCRRRCHGSQTETQVNVSEESEDHRSLV